MSVFDRIDAVREKLWTSSHRLRRLNIRFRFKFSALEADQIPVDRMESVSDDPKEAMCAFAPGKQEWKRAGNYYSPEELQVMDRMHDFTLSRPSKPALSGDF